MITPKEIKVILQKNNFKQNNKSFGFDAALKGLGVVINSNETKKETPKSFNY